MKEGLTAKELDRQFGEHRACDSRIPKLYSLCECEARRRYGYGRKQRERRECT